MARVYNCGFAFSTLPRVELPGAGRAPGKPQDRTELSVPYLGSNCLERNKPPNGHPLPYTFQYPTSGRTAWSNDKQVRQAMKASKYFQYPTSGRTAWSRCEPSEIQFEN